MRSGASGRSRPPRCARIRLDLGGTACIARIAVLIVRSSWSLLREAVAVLMEWAPEHVDVEAIHRSSPVPSVIAVHDLHVWTIASAMVALSGHVVAGGS
jgi:Co/Zn/Cd efflux system component